MNFSDGQRSGAMAVLIVALTFYGGTLLSQQWPSLLREVPWGKQGTRTAAIEIALGSHHDGVYFVTTPEELATVLRHTGLSERLPAPLRQELYLLRKNAYRVSLAGEVMTLGSLFAASSLTLGLTVDLNSASLQDLILIPGIGEKTATAIVTYREKQGPFRDLSDLKQVPGIGNARLRRFSAYLQVDNF